MASTGAPCGRPPLGRRLMTDPCRTPRSTRTSTRPGVPGYRRNHRAPILAASRPPRTAASSPLSYDDPFVFVLIVPEALWGRVACEDDSLDLNGTGFGQNLGKLFKQTVGQQLEEIADRRCRKPRSRRRVPTDTEPTFKMSCRATLRKRHFWQRFVGSWSRSIMRCMSGRAQ